MAKLLKNYICLVSLLLVALVSNVNAAEPTKFTFKIENKSDKFLTVIVQDKEEKYVIGKVFQPGQTLQFEEKLNDPGTSTYGVFAQVDVKDEENFWNIAADYMDKSESKTIDAVNFKGAGKKELFNGNTATFSLDAEKGTFNVTVEGKSKPVGGQGDKS